MLTRLGKLVFEPVGQNIITGLIILNAIILGLATSPVVMRLYGPVLNTLDSLILALFVIELSLKILTSRSRFFKDGWNIFDFFIILLSLAPSTGPLSILRAFRILRALRLVTHLPRLRLIVESILYALPGIGWLSTLLLLVFYIFSVLVTSLFGEAFPQWFGSIGDSIYTLFQIVTMDSWSSGIARPVMEVFPYAYLLFVPFIILSAFVILNVFISIIVSSMGAIQDINNKRALNNNELLAELAKLKEQIMLVEAIAQKAGVVQAKGDAGGPSSASSDGKSEKKADRGLTETP